MPNGWKKNAKYFEPLTMSHNEYIRKKQHFRDWKKKYNYELYSEYNAEKSKRFIEQYYNDCRFGMMGNYKDNSFYLSKHKIKGSGSTYRRRGIPSDQFYKNFISKLKKKRRVYFKTKLIKHNKIILDNKKIKITNKNEITIKTDYCSICCEEKKINYLFTIDCKRKGILKFRGGDKIVCSDCIYKMNSTCPYCKSHSIKFVKARLRHLKINNASKMEAKRKERMNFKLSVISFNDRDKFDEKRRYPSHLIYTQISRNKQIVPLDNRLYKWINTVKNPCRFYPQCFRWGFDNLELVEKNKAPLNVLYFHGVIP